MSGTRQLKTAILSKSGVEARGWQLKRIKIDDGCYEIHAVDADGQRFEAKIDPQTLRVIEIEHEHRRR